MSTNAIAEHKQRISLAMDREAVEILSLYTTERKRGEFLAKLIREYHDRQQGIPLQLLRDARWTLEAVEAQLLTHAPSPHALPEYRSHTHHAPWHSNEDG